MPNSTLIQIGSEAFCVIPHPANQNLYVVRQEFPVFEFLGLVRWDDQNSVFLVLQVGVVPLPVPQAIARLEDVPIILRGLLMVVLQPLCMDCKSFDSLRGLCRKRRDPQPDWLNCYLPIDAGDRACSLFDPVVGKELVNP